MTARPRVARTPSGARPCSCTHRWSVLSGDGLRTRGHTGRPGRGALVRPPRRRDRPMPGPQHVGPARRWDDHRPGGARTRARRDGERTLARHRPAGSRRCLRLGRQCAAPRVDRGHVLGFEHLPTGRRRDDDDRSSPIPCARRRRLRAAHGGEGDRRRHEPQLCAAVHVRGQMLGQWKLRKARNRIGPRCERHRRCAQRDERRQPDRGYEDRGRVRAHLRHPRRQRGALRGVGTQASSATVGHGTAASPSPCATRRTPPTSPASSR